MYDIVFISFAESNAEDNWNLLRSRFADAKRLHGIVGLHKAHIAASHMVRTDMFYVVDGDAVIDDGFGFDYEVRSGEQDHVHVFRARNPINDLVYGYGAVKLLPTTDVRALAERDFKPDMTTSINRRYKVIHELSNVTAFNTDDYNSWRSAFRECAKLSSKVIDGQVDEETSKRLDTWCTIGGDRPHGHACMRGALAGRAFGEANAGDMDRLKLINDHIWMASRYATGDDA